MLLLSCTQDSEAAVRARLGALVALGDTLHFDSRSTCTAGMFDAAGVTPKSPVRLVRSGREAWDLARRGQVIGFDIEGWSPSDISARLREVDREMGIGVVLAGVGARGCLTAEVETAYVAALKSLETLMIWDGEARTLVLLDRAARRVFYLSEGAS